MITREQCIAEAAELQAVSYTRMLSMTPEEQARAALTPTGPSYDELLIRVKEWRARRRTPQTSTASLLGGGGAVDLNVRLAQPSQASRAQRRRNSSPASSSFRSGDPRPVSGLQSGLGVAT